MNNQMDFVLPALYDKFLSEMGEDGEFIIENTGIILYSKADLVERNTTYQIEEWEPDFFMIGQDGDLAFFIKKDSDDTIYMNDLGALGSIEMKRTASDVYEFVKHAGEDLNVLNEIYAKSLEFGDNICTPVGEIVKKLYPNISNEDKINLADYIEQTKDSIEKYFYDNYDYKNEGVNAELQYKGEQWIKENYCWMNNENIKRAVSQGMYYAWHG